MEVPRKLAGYIVDEAPFTLVVVDGSCVANFLGGGRRGCGVGGGLPRISLLFANPAAAGINPLRAVCIDFLSILMLVLV